MLEFYIDDSRDEKGTAVLVAGYLARADQWETFIELQQRLLADAGVPLTIHDTRIFHMTDFENSALIPRSPFHLWSRDRKAEFMGAMARLIAAQTLMGAMVCAPYRDAETAMPHFPTDFPKLKPLGMAVLELVKCARLWSVVHESREPITYVIDSVTDRADIASVMNKIEHDAEFCADFRFHKWTWGTAARNVPIQAADVLAYECHKEWVNFYQQGGTIKVRKLLGAFGPTLHYHKLLDHATLVSYANQVRMDLHRHGFEEFLPPLHAD